MKCRKLITATKASRIKPCERTIRKLKTLVFFFYEEQHCGIALSLDRDEEKHLLCGTYKSSGIFVFVQHKGDPQNRMCLYTGILTELWKSGRSLTFCQCSGLQW